MGTFENTFSKKTEKRLSNMRRQLAGPGSSTSNWKATTDPGKAAAAGTGGRYGRVGTAAGPSSGKESIATKDSGKMAPAGTSGNYRGATTAVGPAASGATYVATQDSGKMAPAGSSGGNYRGNTTAVGPAASGADYVSTQDSGKQAPAGAAGQYRAGAGVVGPQSGKETLSVHDPGLQQPVSGGV